MILRVLTLVLAATLALPGCQSSSSNADGQLTVTSTSNPRLRIPSNGTYSWMEGSMIVRDPRLSSEVYPILLDELESGFKRRGYSRLEYGEPDLLVGVIAALAGTVKDAEINQAYGLDSTWLPDGLSSDDYAAGSIVLDVIDARTSRSLWRGAVHGAAKFERTTEERREHVKNAIETLLTSFDSAR